MLETGALLVIVGLTLIAGAHAVWWMVLAIAATRPPVAAEVPRREWQFAVVVPAHNEEANITATLAALMREHYEPRPKLVVVADNCSDRTAAIALDCGAEVVERFDAGARGKGYALAAGIASVAKEPPDALVVVDADTVVESGFFAGLAAELDRGARVVQGHYCAEPGTSNVGRLRRLAFHLVHYVRPLGTVRLGGGVGLKGNGMAFRWDVVEQAGVSGRGITEDAEHSLALAERGIAVAFAPNARLTGAMAQGYRAAATQDRRWEGGRGALRRRAIAVGARRLMAGDWGSAVQAFEIALLPLTVVVAAVVAAAAVDAAVVRTGISFVAVVPLTVYLALGLLSARPTRDEAKALLSAPLFIAYKVAILLESLVRKPGGWERTERSSPVPQLAGAESDQSANPRAK